MEIKFKGKRLSDDTCRVTVTDPSRQSGERLMVVDNTVIDHGNFEWGYHGGGPAQPKT
jgi:hypothetical protein